MIKMDNIGIAGLGTYLPEDIIYVKDIKEQAELSDQRVKDMGIVKVHVAGNKVEPTDMAIEAAKNAMADAGVTPEEIDVIVYYSVFPDYLRWADYARVQHDLGAKNAYAFKVDQVCCSGIIGLDYALAKLRTDLSVNTILITTADKYEWPLVNRWKGANANFYGDGASAAVIKRGVKSNRILGIENITDGSFSYLWKIPVGGAKQPPTPENIREGGFRLDFIKTAKDYLGSEESRKQLYSLMINNNKKITAELLNQHGYTLQDIDKLVMYNLGHKTLDKIINTLEMDVENTSYYVTKNVGHIGAADIFYNLKTMIDDKKIVSGDLVSLFSAGIGFSWSSALIQFNGE
ncbi:MAG: hypothetical protein KAX49_08410 [Halanaerobiales bacterium]|nr:hypothetical protein [Halanaerobiales bacterium]